MKCLATRNKNHKNTIPKQLLKFWIYFYKKEKIHISANTIIYTFQNLILEIIFNTNSNVKIRAIILHEPKRKRKLIQLYINEN